jgi:tripartite-type tricarboxylate transporter receptor subunit TctC
MLARLVGGKLADSLGQQVVVDNRAGANGIIAADLTANALPDGYTLQVMSISHTMNAAIYKLPFDPVKSFTPVARLATGPFLLVTHPSFPATSVKALIDLAKAKPKTITYAVSGTGGNNHFAGALFSHMAGIQLLDVPYRGGPQALTDLIAGEVQIMFATLALTHRQVKAGKLTALGVSSSTRSRMLPEVPTINEAGLRGYDMNTWWGVIGPARMPGSVTDRLNREISSVLAQPELAKRLEMDGAEPAPASSAEFGRLLASEVDQWRRVAKTSNIKAE